MLPADEASFSKNPVNGYATEMLPVLDAAYIVTAGERFPVSPAGVRPSLCFGDSGGPLYLGRSPIGTGLLVGINSDYTFDDNSGVSRTNIHTRLGTVLWLPTVLPSSSFYIPLIIRN